MKRLIKFISIVILFIGLYSLIPVGLLYLKSNPIPYRNEEIIERLSSNKGEHFAFVVLGDNHAGLAFNDSATLKLIRHINREDRFKKIPIDFTMVTGDVTNRGSLWDYRIYNKIRSLIRWPVISAMGNHDNDGGGDLRFKKYIGEREFSFTNRNSYFIVLDNEIGNLSDGQFARLEDELKKSLPYKHRFIVMHKTPLSPYQQSWYRPELSSWSYRFMKLCEDYKVDMVFSGHEHMFKEMAFDGVKYIVSGGGGMLIQIPEADGGFLHYVVVRIRDDYVDYEVRKIFPPFWEILTYYMWKEIFYFLRGIVF